jgi:competence ComEA-like helix-hairpin-helix protein
MVLVLASGRAGQFNDIHDFAVYPCPQRFVQPRLSGSVGYLIDGARVQITVERLQNPRPATNRSGTLSLELWALPAPYRGGRFHGCHLAGVEIGVLNGQDELALQPLHLAFTPPPAGEWQIVLMLREWTAAGFVTRDFTNFPILFRSAPVVEKAPVSVPEEPPAPVAVKPASPAALKAPEPVTPEAALGLRPQPGATVVAKAPMSVVRVSEPSEDSAKRVSVNTANIEQLAAVKGLSMKLAEGIVKKRPFASLEDLRRVKGFGASILAKVRSSLKL